jgi:hypothetical protein
MVDVMMIDHASLNRNIIQNWLGKERVCKRCGKWYKLEENTVKACHISGLGDGAVTKSHWEQLPGWYWGQYGDVCPNACFYPYIFCCPCSASKDSYVLRMRQQKKEAQARARTLENKSAEPVSTQPHDAQSVVQYASVVTELGGPLQA